MILGKNIESGLVSIVILSFNRLDLTRVCVESVMAHTPEPYEVLVVDNGSTDGTQEYLLDLQSSSGLIRPVLKEKNYGVCARNFGFQVARGGFMCWLDNDVEVGPGWLTPFLEAMKNPEVGGVGHGGHIVGPEWHNILVTSDYPPEQVQGLRVDVLGGCCFMHRNLVNFIGFLDWAFSPRWNAECDYSLRIKLLGLALEVWPNNIVHHAHGTGWPGVDSPERLIEENTIYLHRKWEPFKQRVLEMYLHPQGYLEYVKSRLCVPLEGDYMHAVPPRGHIGEIKEKGG